MSLDLEDPDIVCFLNTQNYKEGIFSLDTNKDGMSPLDISMSDREGDEDYEDDEEEEED